MAYVPVEKGIPGIRSLVMYRPETGKYLYELAQELLRGDSPLKPAERELIAAYVSSLNGCKFCMESHAAASRALYGDKEEIVSCTINQVDTNQLSPKMKALLNIAAKVAESGKSVLPDDIDQARKLGAVDLEIHDTVLVAAAFCMYNRYVDGLDSFTPDDPEAYKEMGIRLATHGYVPPKSNT